MDSSVLWFFLFSILISPWISWGDDEPKHKLLISVRQQDSLRYHLENFYNEVDLLIQNEMVDQFDLQRQERDLATLKIFERIPLNRELAQLKKALIKSAKTSGLHLSHIDVHPWGSTPTPPLPPLVYTDSSFRLRTEQLVEKIKIVMRVQGDDVQKWKDSFPDSVIRYVAIDHVKRSGNSWHISAHAFRFRNIRFPLLKPKNPLAYLPAWARKNPEKFSQAEPALWSIVKRIEALIPRTPRLYETRGKFLLNDARLSFVMHLEHYQEGESGKGGGRPKDL